MVEEEKAMLASSLPLTAEPTPNGNALMPGEKYGEMIFEMRDLPKDYFLKGFILTELGRNNRKTCSLKCAVAYIIIH